MAGRHIGQTRAQLGELAFTTYERPKRPRFRLLHLKMSRPQKSGVKPSV